MVRAPLVLVAAHVGEGDVGVARGEIAGRGRKCRHSPAADLGCWIGFGQEMPCITLRKRPSWSNSSSDDQNRFITSTNSSVCVVARDVVFDLEPELVEGRLARARDHVEAGAAARDVVDRGAGLGDEGRAW